MSCKNCGKELKENSKFCTNCGASLENKVDSKKKNEIVKEMPGIGIAAYILAGIILLNHLVFGYSIITLNGDSVFSSLLWGIIVVPILYIIGLVLAIVMKAKYSRYSHSNILIIIYVVLGIILVLEFIQLISLANSCINDLKSCNG